jgi:hypothetical protein
MEMAPMPMTGMYGPYPMTREASGTNWLPDSAPIEGKPLVEVKKSLKQQSGWQWVELNTHHDPMITEPRMLSDPRMPSCPIGRGACQVLTTAALHLACLVAALFAT